jgi:hypothetical protein
VLILACVPAALLALAVVLFLALALPPNRSTSHRRLATHDAATTNHDQVAFSGSEESSGNLVVAPTVPLPRPAEEHLAQSRVPAIPLA